MSDICVILGIIVLGQLFAIKAANWANQEAILKLMARRPDHGWSMIELTEHLPRDHHDIERDLRHLDNCKLTYTVQGLTYLTDVAKRRYADVALA